MVTKNFKIGSCIQYVYFGDEINNSEFEVGLDPSDSKIKVLNYEEFNLIPKIGSIIYDIYYDLFFYNITLPIDSILPENWENMKCHIVFVFKQCDENNVAIEGEYGVFQIHQKWG